MIDNSQDKGYLAIQLEETDNGFYLREQSFLERPNVFDFFIDYEDGTIFIDLNDGEPRKVIGHYEKTLDERGMARVYDASKSRVIGRVGGELIFFVLAEADRSANRFLPEQKCLAWYTSSGTITSSNSVLERLGNFNGSEIGGAASFVATFFTYNFHSVFKDYFYMDADAFRAKYPHLE